MHFPQEEKRGTDHVFPLMGFVCRVNCNLAAGRNKLEQGEQGFVIRWSSRVFDPVVELELDREVVMCRGVPG